MGLKKTFRITADSETGSISSSISFYRGNSVAIQIGIFNEDLVVDHTQIASLRLEIKSTLDEGFVPEIAKDITSFSALTADTWEAETAQHCTVSLLPGDTNHAPGKYFLVIVAVGTGGEELTAKVGRVNIINDGYDGLNASPPTIAGRSYYSTTEINGLLDPIRAALTNNYDAISSTFAGLAGGTNSTGETIFGYVYNDGDPDNNGVWYKENGSSTWVLQEDNDAARLLEIERSGVVASRRKLILNKDDGYIYFPELWFQRQGTGPVTIINPANSDYNSNGEVVTIGGVKYFRAPLGVNFQHFIFLDVSKYNESPKQFPIVYNSGNAATPAFSDDVVFLGSTLGNEFSSHLSFDTVDSSSDTIESLALGIVSNDAELLELNRRGIILPDKPLIFSKDDGYLYIPNFILKLRGQAGFYGVNPNNSDYDGNSEVVTISGTKYFRIVIGQNFSEDYYYDWNKTQESPKQFPIVKYQGSNTPSEPYSRYLVKIGASWEGLFNTSLPYVIQENGRTFGLSELDTRLNTAEEAAETVALSDPNILFPDNIYILNGRELPIYVENLYPVRPMPGNAEFIYRTLLSNKPKSEFTRRQFLLNDSELGTTLDLYLKDTNTDSVLYKKTVNVRKAPASTSATINWNPIGDSITNRETASKAKAKLESLGATVNMIGTLNMNGGVVGEGRESWSISNFYGGDNLRGTSPIVPSSTSPSSVLLNPFLKLADSRDKAVNPQWCFTNTGVDEETNYQTNPNLGDYYIFDYAYYLSQQGFTTPEVITVALGVNDSEQLAQGDVLGRISGGLAFIINRIKSAAPNAKIGVVSEALGMSMTLTQYNQEIVPIIKKKLELFDDVQTDVHVVPVWAHQATDVAFPASNGATNSQTGVITQIVSDSLHPDDFGREQYAEVVAAFVMWCISELGL